MEQALRILTEGAGHVLTFLNGVPPEVYVLILASLPFSVIVAFAKTFIQRKWDVVPSETKLFLTNFFGIVLMAVGAYLSMTPEQDPVVAIFGLVGATTAVQQPVYFRFIKPFVKNFWAEWDKGKTLNDELRSAALPENGLPIETK